MKTTTKKITKATFKSFINKNLSVLEVKIESSFDGMTDCVQSIKDNFKKVTTTNSNVENTLGIDGVWLVGSRDWFNSYETETHIGIEYYNCCGSGVIAIPK